MRSWRDERLAKRIKREAVVEAKAEGEVVMLKSEWKKKMIGAMGLMLGLGAMQSTDVHATELFVKQRDSSGAVVRMSGPQNLNGFREPMVRWNECGDSSIGPGAGQVTWDYSQARAEAGWPVVPGLMVGCTDRRISETFLNFLNTNFARCVSMGTLPETQLEIATVLAGAGSKENADTIDNHVSSAVRRIEAVYEARLEEMEEDIKSIRILHQGIQGDSNHSSRSYHSAAVLRALDLSHVEVEYKFGSKTVYQHNVGTYAENAQISGRSSSLNQHQLSQQRFWQVFGACITAKGGAVISKVLHHTSSGRRHAGHVHVSLPYRNRGSYNSKDFDPGFNWKALALHSADASR